MDAAPTRGCPACPAPALTASAPFGEVIPNRVSECASRHSHHAFGHETCDETSCVHRPEHGITMAGARAGSRAKKITPVILTGLPDLSMRLPQGTASNRPRRPAMPLSSTELMIIAGILLLVFGSSLLPKFARSLREARKELTADR